MTEFLSFLYKHIELSIAFVVVVLLILWEELYARRFVRGGISPQETINLINHKNAVVLDIRAAEAFNQGYIIHSINIPSGTLETQLKKLAKYKNTPIIVVDGNGQGSMRIVSKLKEKDFQNVLLLSGGLSAWNQAGLPLTHDTVRDKL